MVDKFTPGPWRQGVTLVTDVTRRWTTEQVRANNAREELEVYAYLSEEDGGVRRELVARCVRVEDAELVAAAPLLLAAVRAVVAQLPGGGATLLETMDSEQLAWLVSYTYGSLEE